MYFQMAQGQSLATTLFGSTSSAETAALFGFHLLFALACFFIGLFVIPEFRRKREQRAYWRSLVEAKASLSPIHREMQYLRSSANSRLAPASPASHVPLSHSNIVR